VTPLPLALLASLTLSASPSTPTAAEAAAVLYRGDPDGALRLTDALLEASPGDVTARLLATCAAIEGGHLERAGTLLAPLEALRPPPPRAAVLRRLIARRAGAPREPLLRALAASWSLVGRPDLEEDEPLLRPPSPADPGPPAGLGAAERLLFDLPREPEAQKALAIEAAHDLDGRPLVASLEILGILASQPCPKDPAGRDEAVAQALRTARRADPGNGYVELAGLLARCPRGLGAADVAALGEVAARPTCAYPRERAFRELLDLATRLDAPSARRRAISSWLGLDVAGYQLVQLAEAFPDPVGRRRLGVALEALGRRQAADSAWFDQLVASSLVERGARLAGDEAYAAAVADEVAKLRERFQSATDARKALGQWPFAASWREWSADEVGAAWAFMAAISAELTPSALPGR
jgi:hypothetical protein